MARTKLTARRRWNLQRVQLRRTMKGQNRVNLARAKNNKNKKDQSSH